MLDISRRIILWAMIAPAGRVLARISGQAPPKSSPPQALTLDIIRERLDRAYRTLSSYSAEIWSVSYPSGAAAPPPVQKGRAYLRVARNSSGEPQFRFACDFTAAPKTMVRAEQDAVRILQPESRRLLEGTLDQTHKRFLGPYVEFMGGAKTAYLKNEPVDGSDAALLEMTLAPGADSQVQRVRVWIDLKTDLPVRFDVSYRLSALTVVLRKPRVNEKFADSVFDLQIPAGIKSTRIAVE